MVHLLLVIIYLSFISLGLPDSLLGAAWPMMCQEFSVPVSYAGGIALIIAMGTVVSSLQSDRVTRWLGTGKVTAISVAMTAVALWGFSISTEFWQLCLWGIPYGLGAGSVDAALNNYVALHYASRHMSWLHFMWGVGASTGPYIMGAALTGGLGWNGGYAIIALIQIVLTAVIFLSVPLWKKRNAADAQSAEKGKPLSMKEILAIPGAKEVLTGFFCYCGMEQTCILWGSSYFVMHIGLEEELAASLASLYMIGLTAGRFLSGFVTYKVNDENMIRLGEGIIVLGAAVMLLPVGQIAPMIGLTLMGFGSAPIYPCVIHSTPAHFGEENSQAIIGVQMASAYIGICVMAPLFGLIASHISAGLMPVYVGAITLAMIFMNEQVNRKCTGK